MGHSRDVGAARPVQRSSSGVERVTDGRRAGGLSMEGRPRGGWRTLSAHGCCDCQQCLTSTGRKQGMVVQKVDKYRILRELVATETFDSATRGPPKTPNPAHPASGKPSKVCVLSSITKIVTSVVDLVFLIVFPFEA
jgi:hypothetical protein